jgi:hypothetical protein
VTPRGAGPIGGSGRRRATIGGMSEHTERLRALRDRVSAAKEFL